MSDHTTNEPTNEIPYGYCYCGCGQKTKIATENRPSRHMFKGEPLRFVANHGGYYKARATPPNPTGLCACGCGGTPPLATKTSTTDGTVRGKPVRYIPGHQNIRHHDPEPNPSGLCMCGCGQKTGIANQSRTLTGDVRGKPMRYIAGHNRDRPLEVRFWEKVRQGAANDCWPWVGASDSHGRGMFNVGKTPEGRNRRCVAPRVSWEMHHGPIPPGMNVLHHCDNPSCVNPAHLFLGTQKDNIADMYKKGRRPKR